jgi:hypothetical protein
MAVLTPGTPHMHFRASRRTSTTIAAIFLDFYARIRDGAVQLLPNKITEILEWESAGVLGT